MPLYAAHIELNDDPAWFSADVLVVAEDRKKALKLAKKAAIESYNDQAGGWSSKPKVEGAVAREYTLPKNGVALVSGRYSR